MYIVGNAKTRFKINVGMGAEDPVLILREPTADELRSYLAGRLGRSMRVTEKTVDHLLRSREVFIDSLLIGCENVAVAGPGGEPQPLGTAVGDGWKQKIPVNWKMSVAARFEEREVVSPEDEQD